MTNHRKRLAWGSTDYKIHITLILPCIEITDIRKPVFLVYLVICEVALLTLRVDVTSKSNLMS